MADREMPTQTLQDELVEGLGDEAKLLVDDHRLSVRDRDACRLLTAVLQGVKTVIGETSHVFAGGIDAYDSTSVPCFTTHLVLRS
jgi:hypothetical protein